MSDKEKRVIRVRDVMKTEFDMVDGMTTIDVALRRMKHVETKTLIVDKRSQDDEYGVLIISDIARTVLAKDRAPERVNVYEIMTKPVITVNPEMDIRYCARLFSHYEISRSPVVNHQGQIVGVVSFTDMVLKGLCSDLG
ncbi:MAG: CBS domain-containing protein [Gammaproteobacteria bacterium]|nr:CBS domain-containing protein [Gammaproteobacteria bacterium]